MTGGQRGCQADRQLDGWDRQPRSNTCAAWEIMPSRRGERRRDRKSRRGARSALGTSAGTRRESRRPGARPGRGGVAGVEAGESLSFRCLASGSPGASRISLICYCLFFSTFAMPICNKRPFWGQRALACLPLGAKMGWEPSPSEACPRGGRCWPQSGSSALRSGTSTTRASRIGCRDVRGGARSTAGGGGGRRGTGTRWEAGGERALVAAAQPMAQWGAWRPGSQATGSQAHCLAGLPAEQLLVWSSKAALPSWPATNLRQCFCKGPPLPGQAT